MILLNKMKTKNEFFKEIITLIKSKQPNIPKIKKLLNSMEDNSIEINAKKYRGRTLAHYAVKYNNKKIIPILVKHGLNLEICDDDYNTPLHMAILLKRDEMVKELINSGANVNASANLEQTPLHLSVTTGSITVCKMLLDANADTTLVDENNLRPIDYAVDEKNQALIDLLYNYQGGQE